MKKLLFGLLMVMMTVSGLASPSPSELPLKQWTFFFVASPDFVNSKGILIDPSGKAKVNAGTPGAAGDFVGELGVLMDAQGRMYINCSGCGSGSGTVTVTGAPANGNLTKFSGGTSITNADLSGDVTTSGTAATTVVQVEGAAIPTSANVIGTNGSKQLIASSPHNISVPLQCAAASASGTSYTCTTSPSFVPADGDAILFEADVANTGASTLNVNASSAAPIKKQGGGTALIANDLLAGQDTLLIYDGANWQMQGQIGNPGGSGLSGMTANFIPKAATATTITGNSALDDGATVASTVSTSENINIAGQSIDQGSLSNCATGTVLNKLAQRNTAASPACWTIAALSSTQAAGVCVANCGNSGIPLIVEIGRAPCVTDGATTVGHIIIPSASVSGDCSDSTIAFGGSLPGTTEAVGVIDTTNGSAGTFTVDINPPDLTLPGAGGGGKLKGSGTTPTFAYWTGNTGLGATGNGTTGVNWDNTNNRECIGLAVGASCDAPVTVSVGAGAKVADFTGSGVNTQFFIVNTKGTSWKNILQLTNASSGQTHGFALQTDDPANGTDNFDIVNYAIGGGTSAFIIDTNNAVGIGTSSTVATADNIFFVPGTGKITSIVGSGAGAVGVAIQGTGAPGPTLGFNNSSNGQGMITFATAGTNLFQIRNSENLVNANTLCFANPGAAAGGHNDFGIGGNDDIYLGFINSGLPNDCSGLAGPAGSISFAKTIGGAIADQWGKLGTQEGVQLIGRGLTLVAGGSSIEVVLDDLLTQGAAIATTTIFAVPVSGQGTNYRISWNAKVTRAATTSSVLGGTNGVQITYTDADDSVVVTKHCNAGYNSTDAGLNTTGAQISGDCTINAKLGTNIQRSFDYTSVGGTTMQYSLHDRVEEM